MKKRQMDRVFSKLNIQSKPCKHHVRGFFEMHGVKVFSVYYSFGSGEMPRVVAERLAKSMGIKPQQLKALADCHMSYEQFLTKSTKV